MKKSLRQIEDRYVRKGFSGARLRRALEKDKEYANLLSRKRSRIPRKAKVSKADRKRYVLSTSKDHGILRMVCELENYELSDFDRDMIDLIRTQLEHDWRTPLMKLLQRLHKKYKSVTTNQQK
ncbi:MAG: hypothetical protein HY367_02505 [Candidatus Aenigmarchaeota archaeon]|nr:hypothetical protein [Candidatus Aenigmarchaeota archaeon]